MKTPPAAGPSSAWACGCLSRCRPPGRRISRPQRARRANHVRADPTSCDGSVAAVSRTSCGEGSSLTTLGRARRLPYVYDARGTVPAANPSPNARRRPPCSSLPARVTKPSRPQPRCWWSGHPGVRFQLAQTTTSPASRPRSRRARRSCRSSPSSSSEASPRSTRWSSRSLRTC